MSDNLRGPFGIPEPDEDGSEEGEVTEEDYKEVEDMDEAISDDPTVEDASERQE